MGLQRITPDSLGYTNSLGAEWELCAYTLRQVIWLWLQPDMEEESEMLAWTTGRLSARLSVLLIAVMFLWIIAPSCGADSKLESTTVSSITNLQGDLFVNAGKGEGVVVGATGSIIRDGKEIAKFKVIDVNWGASRIDVYDVQNGMTVKPGDRAPILTNPAPKKSKSSVGKIIGAVVVIGLIAALAHGHGGGGGGGQDASGITLTTDKTSTSSGDGSVTVNVTITAKINKSNGEAVADGTAVTFAATAGTLNHTQTYAQAGIATAVLSYNSATDPDSSTVTVRCAGQTAKTTISFATSVSIASDLSTIQIAGSGGASTQSTITATCKDVTGNPITSGTVNFKSSLGTVTDSAALDSNGQAVATFTSSQAGKATITATYKNSTASVIVTVMAGVPNSVVVTASPTSVACDGNTSSRISAYVTDPGGNAATDGTIVNFSVAGDGTGGNGTITAQATTSNGTATANLTTKDSSGVKSIPGTATVTAHVPMTQPSGIPAPTNDSVEGTTTVRFIPTSVSSINVAASKQNVGPGGSTTLTAYVKSTDNNAVADGTMVEFTTSQGLLAGNPTTTSGGQATVTLTASSAPSGNGIVTVSATAGGVTSESITLIFSGPASKDYSLCEITPSTLAKSSGQATVKVTVLDANRNPVADGTTISAVASEGSLLSSSAQTSGGVALFTLMTSTDAANPTQSGPATVTVTVPAIGSGPSVVLTGSFTVSP